MLTLDNEEPEQNFETTFLGVKPKPDADTSKGLDLGKILRSDKIKDLVVLKFNHFKLFNNLSI